MVFIRQMLQQEQGLWKEKATSLHIFIVDSESEPVELAGAQRAEVVRSLQRIPRVKDPVGIAIGAKLLDTEQALIQTLRRPPEAQISAGIRYAVWPLALIVLAT
jgi:hypothetical protein